jgi:hypothetical protein
LERVVASLLSDWPKKGKEVEKVVEGFGWKEAFIFSNGMVSKGMAGGQRGSEFLTTEYTDAGLERGTGFEGALGERRCLFLAKEWRAKEWPEAGRSYFFAPRTTKPRSEIWRKQRGPNWNHGIHRIHGRWI